MSGVYNQWTKTEIGYPKRGGYSNESTKEDDIRSAERRRDRANFTIEYTFFLLKRITVLNYCLLYFFILTNTPFLAIMSESKRYNKILNKIVTINEDCSEDALKVEN